LTSISGWSQVINAPQLTVGTQDSSSQQVNDNAIKLINSEYGTFYLNEDNTINVVVGNVIFEHKGERLYADSARLNITNNTLHAYKNVKITQQDGTTCYADYMFYNGQTEIVELVGHVQIISQQDNLWSDKIIYNLKTNIGYYNTGGVLQSNNTVISSRYAQYNANTYDARFKGNVNVEDPDYLIISSDLNYNTESRIAKFYGPSIIKSDSTILYTTDGYYDTYNEVAQFNKRSSIFSQKQYIEADTMDYDKKTSLGIGRGQVVLIDSARKINIYGHLATINELTGQAYVTIQPFAMMYDTDDTTWVVADTFFTEPTKNLLLYNTETRPTHLSPQDSLLYTLDILRRAMVDIDTTLSQDTIVNDTTEINIPDEIIDDSVNIDIPIVDSNLIDPIRGYIDTIQQYNPPYQEDSLSTDKLIQNFDSLLAPTTDTLERLDIPMVDSLSQFERMQTDTIQNNEEPRYLVAYHNVFIYNDSFQAKCDSLRYSQEDTLLVLYKNPVLWYDDQQVIGEVIKAFVDSQEIRYIHIPKNGILIAQSTLRNEVMFDQIQANEIWAFFSNNKIDSVIGKGNAQTIYYPKDEDNRYIGVSKASSMHLKMVFDTDSTSQDKRLTEVIYYTDHEQEMFPLKEAPLQEMKLSRFKWRKNEKMANKDAFIDTLRARTYSSDLRENINQHIQKDKSIKSEH